jgi:hypothetical protein
MPFPSRFLAAAGLALCAASLSAAPSAGPQDTSIEQVAMRSPVTVGGLWCGAGLLRDFTLEIAQHYQQFEARLVRRNKVREITGRIEGASVRTDPLRDHTMELLAQGNELRIVGATGVLALAKGQFFTRAAGGSCRH